MKQYGLRYLYKHLGEILKTKECFEITNHNLVVATVFPTNDESSAKVLDEAGLQQTKKEQYGK